MKQGELKEMKQIIAQEEAAVWSQRHEQEMMDQLRCLQALFSLFLKHKKRVDSFVEKKVVPLGEVLVKKAKELTAGVEGEVGMLEGLLESRAEQPVAGFLSDTRFQVCDGRAGAVLGLLGWRNLGGVGELLFD